MMKVQKLLIYILRNLAILRALQCGGLNWTFASANDRDSYQLEKLNEVWQHAIQNVPFYKMWKEKHALPDKIVSFEEYSKWPILKKSDLQQYAELLKWESGTPIHWSVTGGATGEPLHFGVMLGQGQQISESLLLARAALGVMPGDKIFLFWGHRHFYGNGMKAKIKFFIRRCKDWVNNTYRADACDLSPQYLSFVGRKLRRMKPEVLISYSASLLAFCRSQKDTGINYTNLGLKTIICTAGPLSKEEREEISAFFNAPVYMEYGSMDAGLMGYMTATGHYSVIHRDCIMQTYNDGVGDLNLVTPLYPQYLPLIRYQIGDYLKDCTYTSDGRVETIGEVWGRGSDVVELENGLKFQVQTFMVCAEEIKKILAYQLVKKDTGLEFHIQVSESLTNEERIIIKEKAYSIITELRQVGFEIVENANLIKAPSGKIRLLIDMTIK